MVLACFLGVVVEGHDSPAAWPLHLLEVPMEDRAAISAVEYATEPPVQACRVVLVDDDPMMLRAERRMLWTPDVDVVMTTSVREALGEIRSGNVDAVVSDISMPEATGIDLLRQVRTFDVDLPVILLTGSANVDSATQAVELGAMRYLQKPVDGEVLRDAVASAVRAYRTTKAERISAERTGLGVLTRGRAAIETALDSALDSLHLLYQPILATATGEPFAYEALVRSHEPSVPHPGALLAIAERLGRIHDVGRAVRATAAAAVRERLPGGVVMFVNLHPDDLQDHELYDPRTPLSAVARRVVLEITERSALGRIPELDGRIAALRHLGFRIAIDDLGAGYSALSTLAEIVPEVVKLDMSLIRDIDHNDHRRRLVKMLVGACKAFDARVVAEGIETEAEREILIGLSCDLLQGYLLGRPARLP